MLSFSSEIYQAIALHFLNPLNFIPLRGFKIIGEMPERPNGAAC